MSMTKRWMEEQETQQQAALHSALREVNHVACTLDRVEELSALDWEDLRYWATNLRHAAQVIEDATTPGCDEGADLYDK